MDTALLKKGLQVDVRVLCDLEQELAPIRPKSDNYPAGIPRQLAVLLDGLGWLAPAAWYTAPPASGHFRYENFLIEVPRAANPETPGVFEIAFQPAKNSTLMLKTVEFVALNCTAARFGRFVPLDVPRANSLPVPGVLNQRIGVEDVNGQFVKPQSIVKQDTGTWIARFLNFDRFSVARYCLEVEGWVIP